METIVTKPYVMGPLEKEIMAHRYLYHVLAKPVITDYQYDKLYWAVSEGIFGEDSPIFEMSSDSGKDYDDEIKQYALTM